MSASIDDKVEGLVNELKSLREELIRLDRVGADMKLAPSATEEDIRRAEKDLGFRFPPSYRVFLQLHNGWYQFWPDWSLLGVSGSLTKKMQQDARRTMGSYRNVAHRDGETKVSELIAREKRDPKTIYPPHHTVMATDFNGGLMVFDRNRRRANGESPIIELRYASVQFRFEDFPGLLKYAILDTEKDIKEYIAENPQEAKASVSRKKPSKRRSGPARPR